LAVASDARAQTSPTGASVVLPSITVTAPADLEKQPTDAASENGLKLNLDVLNLLNTRPTRSPTAIRHALRVSLPQGSTTCTSIRSSCWPCDSPG